MPHVEMKAFTMDFGSRDPPLVWGRHSIVFLHIGLKV